MKLHRNKFTEVLALGKNINNVNYSFYSASEWLTTLSSVCSVSEYLSATVKRELEAQLSRCDGEEVDVDGDSEEDYEDGDEDDYVPKKLRLARKHPFSEV